MKPPDIAIVIMTADTMINDIRISPKTSLCERIPDLFQPRIDKITLAGVKIAQHAASHCCSGLELSRGSCGLSFCPSAIDQQRFGLVLCPAYNGGDFGRGRSSLSS